MVLGQDIPLCFLRFELLIEVARIESFDKE